MYHYTSKLMQLNHLYQIEKFYPIICGVRFVGKFKTVNSLYFTFYWS